MIHLCIVQSWLISATTTILEGCFLVHSPWPICCWCCCRCRLCWCRCCCCSPTTPCSQHKLADLSSTPPLNCTLPKSTQRQAVRVCTQGWSGRPRCTGTWSGTRSHPGILSWSTFWFISSSSSWRRETSGTVGKLQARLQKGSWWDHVPDSVHLQSTINTFIV